MAKAVKLFEILVPTTINGKDLDISYHNAWDEKVCQIAGGLTILHETVGHWMSSSGVIREKMISVKIACTPIQMLDIVSMTKKHYKQESIMVKELRDKVYFL